MKKHLEEIGLRQPGERGPVVHGLRRRTAVRVAESGGSTHEIMAVTGHRTLQMVEEYTRGANQKRLASAAVVRLEHAPNKRLQNGKRRR